MTDSGGFYKKFLLFTIGSVCLLILVGGVVRSTGSGMGCPDWPKCFGNWVPPTHVSELPADYKEAYAQKRHQKNIRLSNYLEYLGFEELVNKLRNDQTILIEESFNSTKTWIEYLNRLLGAVIGFLIALNVIFSHQQRKENSGCLGLAVLNLILVGFQGWVGSIVVSTNLLSGLITFHTILALLILAVLIYNYWLAASGQYVVPKSNNDAKRAYLLIIICIMLFTVQIVIGTQVRESTDLVAHRLGEPGRADWIEQLGLTFYIHRSYSIIILLSHLYFASLAIRIMKNSSFVFFIYSLILLLLFEIVTGVIMAYFAIPPAFQPVHLILATLIFGVDFYLLLLIRKILNSDEVVVEVYHNVE